MWIEWIDVLFIILLCIFIKINSQKNYLCSYLWILVQKVSSHKCFKTLYLSMYLCLLILFIKEFNRVPRKSPNIIQKPSAAATTLAVFRRNICRGDAAGKDTFCHTLDLCLQSLDQWRSMNHIWDTRSFLVSLAQLFDFWKIWAVSLDLSPTYSLIMALTVSSLWWLGDMERLN